MTMRGQRAGIWLACAGVMVAIVALPAVPVTVASAQSAATAQVAPGDSVARMGSEPPVVRPADVQRLSPPGGGEAMGRGGGRGGRGGRGGGRKARMVGHLMSVLTLVGAAGAVYSFQKLRGLRDAHARLQDTIAGQARQLAEIKAMLEQPPRG